MPLTSGKIDDPIDASYNAYPEDPEGMGKTFPDLSLSFAGIVFSPAAILKILKDQFWTANRFGRIEYLLDGFRLGIKEIVSQVGADREKMKEIRERIEGPRFQEAVAVACEEAARATNNKKVESLAKVLAGSLTPTRWSPNDEEVATLIRDFAQLGDQDIRALTILRAAFSDVISNLPNLNDPKQFTERILDYRTAIALAQIQPEDFYASCARLNGFGLAIEVLRNPSKDATA